MSEEVIENVHQTQGSLSVEGQPRTCHVCVRMCVCVCVYVCDVCVEGAQCGQV